MNGASSGRNGRARAMTLIELAVAISISLILSFAIVLLLGQQVRFYTQLQKFRFLREEAPQINSLFATILSGADSYRIYATGNTARSPDASPTRSGTALRLSFQLSSGEERLSVVAQESEGVSGLHYYTADELGIFPETPTWTISRAPTETLFSNENGFLEIRMRDQHGSEITYGGNPD